MTMMVTDACPVPMSNTLHTLSCFILSLSFEVGATIIPILEIKLIDFFKVTQLVRMEPCFEPGHCNLNPRPAP